MITQTNPVVGDRFGFTGREYDPELELYYYRARYYDPQLGRFVSQDPLSFAAGDSNLYRYVGNAPLTTRDPLGLAGDALFYGLMANRASSAAGAVVGGVLGFACGWVEGFTEVVVSQQDSDTADALTVARQRAISYAAIGTFLGGTLATLPAVAQFYGGGILLGYAAGLIIARAPKDPWQVTAVRVGCVVISAAIGPAAQRGLTDRIGRLPFLGGRSPNAPRSPTSPVPRGRANGAPEPTPTPKPPSSKATSEPAPLRPGSPLRQRQFRFMEDGEVPETALQTQATQRTLGLREPSSDELIVARYQRYYTEGWQQVVRRFNQGKITVPAGMNWRTILGQEVDAIARTRLRLYLTREGIAEGPGTRVLVNRRLNDPSGSGKYRIPDVRLEDSRLIMDGTIGGKTMNSPQVRDFQAFSGGYRVRIIRPRKG